MTAPDLTPQGTPWRTTAPDPAESRWWWVHRGGHHFAVAAEWDAQGLDVDGVRIFTPGRPWPAGWRCAPVLTGEYERGRADEAAACAGVAYAYAAKRLHEGDDFNRGGVTAAQTIGARIRARIAAPRPEAAPGDWSRAVEESGGISAPEAAAMLDAWDDREPARPRPRRVAEGEHYGPSPLVAIYRDWVAAGRPAPAPARCETCNGVVPASVEEVAALRRALATVADVVRSEVDGDRCTACTDTLNEDGSGHHASCPLGRIRDALGVRRG